MLQRLTNRKSGLSTIDQYEDGPIRCTLRINFSIDRWSKLLVLWSIVDKKRAASTQVTITTQNREQISKSSAICGWH